MQLSTNRELSFYEIWFKTTVVHVVTYFIAGLCALLLLEYGQQDSPLDSMFRGIDHPLVMAGPLIQVVRGFLFASVFYPLQAALFQTDGGWLTLFWMLFVLGVLSTFGPPPGSIEAMIYTTLPISIWNYAEVVPQALSLSILLAYWLANPEARWFSWLLIISATIIASLIVAGLTTL